MKVKCLQCNKISNKREFAVSDEECELCGSHTLYTCPHCGDSDEYLFRKDAREYKILNQNSSIEIYSSKSLKKAKEELSKIARNAQKEGFIVKNVSEKEYTINNILIYIK
jgi:hypothetical protein